MTTSIKPYYKRILLKLSGEALMGDQSFGIDPNMLEFISNEINEIKQYGVEISLVVGGGNIFRGEGLTKNGINRVTADQMGMLATVMNSLALQNALEAKGMFVRVMSALEINQVCEDYVRRRAVRHLEKGRVVVFTAGTGNPYFTTDSAASLRGLEVNTDVVIKATNVDGVYDSDPKKNKDAIMFTELKYDRVLKKKLNVMDATAIVLCREQKMPIRVYNMNVPGLLKKIVIDGESHGTLVKD